jgi:hypothetical protein
VVTAGARASRQVGLDIMARVAEEFYKRLCTGHLHAVLETLEYLKSSTKVWVEITTLLIPGHNDSPEEVKKLSEWVMTKLGPDVPLHFTAFHPDYKMLDVPYTRASTLTTARDIAQEVGLHFVYTGNVHDETGQSCSSIGFTLPVSNRRADAMKKADRIEGLLHQVTDRPGFQRAFTYALVRESSDEDDRDAVTGPDEAAMQLHATHAWHLHIGDEARRVGNAVRAQKRLGRGKSPSSQAERSNEFSCGLADHFIVFDDSNQWSVGHRSFLCSFSKIGGREGPIQQAEALAPQRIVGSYQRFV